ncbi:MAG: hypothetical protein E6Q89_02830 [Bacteroidia bacterium]|nr:MAG: hypothetical protein E6Q89_02830 [Bacteroidia bacterium]
MKLIKLGILLFMFWGCKTNDAKKNIIAFSCIRCNGCVSNNLNYIKEKNLDKTYKIIIDTSCYEEQMNVLNSLIYEQMPNSEIEKKFGRFGNFILIDSVGKKTEFLTDMNIKDFIQ